MKIQTVIHDEWPIERISWPELSIMGCWLWWLIDFLSHLILILQMYCKYETDVLTQSITRTISYVTKSQSENKNLWITKKMPLCPMGSISRIEEWWSLYSLRAQTIQHDDHHAAFKIDFLCEKIAMLKDKDWFFGIVQSRSSRPV